MNMKLVGVVLAVSGLGLVACGDSTGTGTGSGGGGTGGSTSSAGGGTTSAGGGGTGGASCESEHPAGYAMAAGLVIASCGCDAGAGGGGGGTPSACSTECAADPAPCMDPPGDPAGACGTCIQAAAEASDPCAVSAATGPECSGNAECSAYVTCVLSS